MSSIFATSSWRADRNAPAAARLRARRARTRASRSASAATATSDSTESTASASGGSDIEHDGLRRGRRRSAASIRAARASSTSGNTVPRRLARPSNAAGLCGTRATAGTRMTSRTCSAGSAYRAARRAGTSGSGGTAAVGHGALITHRLASARRRARRSPRWPRPDPPLRATAPSPPWPLPAGCARLLGGGRDLARARSRPARSAARISAAPPTMLWLAARISATSPTSLVQHGRDGADCSGLRSRPTAPICSRSLFKTRDLLEDSAHGVLRALDVGRRFARQRADVVRHDRETAARSPARAASTEPLTASMLVCTAISAMASTIFSTFRPMAPSWRRSRRSTACRRGSRRTPFDEIVDGPAARS